MHVFSPKKISVIFLKIGKNSDFWMGKASGFLRLSKKEKNAEMSHHFFGNFKTNIKISSIIPFPCWLWCQNSINKTIKNKTFQREGIFNIYEGFLFREWSMFWFLSISGFSLHIWHEFILNCNWTLLNNLR